MPDDSPGTAPWRGLPAAPPPAEDPQDLTGFMPAEPGPATAPTPALLDTRATGVSIRDGLAPAERPSGERPALGPDERRGFLARYAVVYDVDGPRVRLGIGWALLVGAALAYRPSRVAAVAVLFGATAAWAAYQTVTAWRPGRAALERWVAAVGGAALPLLAARFGVRGLGAGLIGLVAAALLCEWATSRDWRPATAGAARIVTSGGWTGVAAASVVVTLRYEIGAVITLLVLVAVYEASDYIVGSGASNRAEGPLAGIIAIAVVTAVVAFLRVPPFEVSDAFLFGALAAVLCPIGQFAGSGLLPSPDAPASALRRLDSLLVLAPAWAWLIGLLLVHQR